MVEKTPVPTIAFDPEKHAIAGRRLKDGRQLFFSLTSIVAAERAIEAAPAPDPQSAQKSGSEVTHDDLAALEERVVKAARAAAPPPQFPTDMTATLTDLTAAIVALKQQNDQLATRVAKLESDVAIHTQNFAAIAGLTWEKSP